MVIGLNGFGYGEYSLILEGKMTSSVFDNISKFVRWKKSSPSDIVIKWGGKWKAGFKRTASNSPEKVESFDSVIDNIVPFKRDVYTKILEEFKDLF